jgi:predicted MPP superfamily phosphohydrolase
MKIQYFSDIHLEFLKKQNTKFCDYIIPHAPVLVLAGDIGYPFQPLYTKFLSTISKKFKKIFLITGNHEYYKTLGIDETNKKIKEIITENRLDNISFLNNSYEDYQGYRFVGSTLWSKISDNKYLINDFTEIKNLSVEKYNILHAECRKFITHSIETEKPVIMITHHLPSHSLTHLNYIKYSYYQQCFSSSCDDLIRKPVVCWFYGHTHMPMVRTINGVQILCNPIGYPGENVNFDFNVFVNVI